MNGVQSRVCRVNVGDLHVHGPEADNFAVTQGSESASTVALNARKRALCPTREDPPRAVLPGAVSGHGRGVQ